MSRIAPEPIDTGLAMVVGSRPRGRQNERDDTPDHPTDPGRQQSELTPAATTEETPPPVLPDPAGTAFAVALAAVDLPPVPPNPRAVVLKAGANWAPPYAARKLTDRKA